MFARHGFQNLTERVKLGRFILEKFSASSSNIEAYTAPERVRMSFEQLGPVFVKFGQLLATRSDVIPEEFVEEFKKLHDQVPALEFSKIESVLVKHYGENFDKVFESFDKVPLAAGSIAQVHRAKLVTGEDVVVKLLRPGMEGVIREDLNVIYSVAKLLEKYVPESRIYNPINVVDEFFRTMDLETNFMIEANNIRRFTENFADDPNIKIPKVFEEHSAKDILVLEELEGISLSHSTALKQEGIDPEEIIKIGLHAYLKMVFTDGIFHGDLHAGNMFVMPGNKVGLIDFGIVGRLSKKEQSAVANMLIALATEDYERLAYEYLDVTPYREYVDVEKFSRDLRDTVAPYYGLSLEHMNVGKLLMDSSSIAADHKLMLPSGLIMFFKSIVSIEGVGRTIKKDFDFLAHSIEFATNLAKHQIQPKKIAKDLNYWARDVNSLLATLPRHIKQFLRRMSSPDFSFEVEIESLREIKTSIDHMSKSLFFGFTVLALVISSTMILINEKGPQFLEMPLFSFIGYVLALVLVVIFLVF